MHLTRLYRPWRFVLALTLLVSASWLALLLGTGSTARASVDAPPVGVIPRAGAEAELVITGVGAGQNVNGSTPAAGTTFNPLNGYPATTPTGFTPVPQRFLGVITADTIPDGETLFTYCIDIRTSTAVGIGYERGEWEESNVPRLGYIARLLNSYYPTVPNAPAGLASDNERAAAVQAAIWFFSDSYVLADTDPLRDAVAGIVTEVLAAGPVTEEPPDLDITPATVRGPVGSAVGPYTVNTGNPSITATVTATGAQMFTDAAGTVPLANGSVVPDGQQIYLRSADLGAASLEAVAQAEVPSGTVYLYDGQTAGYPRAQSLVLARTGIVRTRVQATAEFFAAGSLRVTKTVSGVGAGRQSQVTITVTCGGTALPQVVIPAGAPPGATSETLEGIEAGTTCTVTETADGANARVSVVVTGSGQTVTVAANEVATVDLSNAYNLKPGELKPGEAEVPKNVAGDGVLPETGAPLGMLGLAALALAMVMSGGALTFAGRRN